MIEFLAGILSGCLASYFGFYAGYVIGKEQRIAKVPRKITHPVENIKRIKQNKDEEKAFTELQDTLKAIDEYDGKSF